VLNIHDSIYYGKYKLKISNNYDYTLNNTDKVYINFELSDKPIIGKTGVAKIIVNNRLVHEEDIYCEKINKRKKHFWEIF